MTQPDENEAVEAAADEATEEAADEAAVGDAE